MKGAANRAKAVQSTACPAASRAPGVLRAPAPQGGQPEQDIEPRPQPRPLPAQEEDQHQQDAVAGVIKIEEADAQKCCGKEPPPPRLEAPHGQQTEEQSEEDVPVHPLRLPVPGVGGQDVTGLGDESKEAQPAQISLDIPGVEQPHRHAVAEDGEGQPPHPAKGGVLWKKHGPLCGPAAWTGWRSASKNRCPGWCAAAGPADAALSFGPFLFLPRSGSPMPERLL